MKPTVKSGAIDDLLEKLSGRTTAITTNRCVDPPVGCGQPITGFRDEISKREYQISGMCQACQDRIWGGN